MKCNPPAKINLALRVLGRRSDGFHDLHTVFQTVGLTDELRITLKRRGGITLNVDRADLPSDGNNLCHRAAHDFAARVAAFPGCHIELKKRIPHEAGLGGGSSDAAWTLILLNRMLDRPLASGDLFELACALGSDVPFFLQGGTALGAGRGEVISPLSVDWDYHILLVCPTVKISTSWAFNRLKIGLTRQANYNIFDTLALKDLNPKSFPEYFTNDFEGLVFARYPVLRKIKLELRNHGAFFASLSGTGSALFGLFFDQKTARQALAAFKSEYRAYLSRPIPAVEP